MAPIVGVIIIIIIIIIDIFKVKTIARFTVLEER